MSISRPRWSSLTAALLHRHPPIGGEIARRSPPRRDSISPSVPCGTGEIPAVRHTSRRRRGLPHLRAFCLARGKGKSDATLEFAVDLPRPRSRHGGTCMWLGAVCRPARQDRGTDDADRRDHAGRRSKGHRAGPPATVPAAEPEPAVPAARPDPAPLPAPAAEPAPSASTAPPAAPTAGERTKEVARVRGKQRVARRDDDDDDDD